MKTLLKIEMDENGDFGQIEYHCKGTDELYALSQALQSLMMRNPEILGGLAAMIDMCKENPEIVKRLRDNTITVPDFNKLLKS